MAKRFIDTELWDKVWHMELDCRLKCLVKMVRDKADIAGIWSPNWTIASAYIGEKVTEKDLLEIDGGNQFKKLENGKIYCLGFVEFQYGELSEKSPVHRKVISILQANGISDTFKIIGYKYPINRVQEEEEDKEEEKDKEEYKIGGLGERIFTIEQCADVAMRDERWVRANKTIRQEVDAFNSYLERQGIYQINPADYKRYFAKLKGKYPDLIKHKFSIEELRQMAREMTAA